MVGATSVLLVDQNPDRRFGIKRLLDERYRVCGEVGYGAAAATLAVESRPDVILCAMEKLLTRSAQTVRTLTELLPHTPVLVYSEDTDLDVARQAMHNGARDFLPLPTNTENLSSAIVTALQAEGRKRMQAAGGVEIGAEGIVVTVFGPKGGIGKTTVTTNLAVALALGGQSVVCVDGDAGFGDVAGMLGVEPEHSVADLSRQIEGVTREQLPRFLAQHSSGLMVLPAPQMALDWRGVSPDSFRKIIERLARSFDVVVIDTSGMLDDISLVSLESASLTLWISTTEFASVRDSQAAVASMRAFPIAPEKFRLVVNQTSPTKDVRPEVVAETLNQEIYWEIPYDKDLRQSSQVGRPVIETNPSSKIADNFRRLARQISGDPVKKTPKRRFGWLPSGKKQSTDATVIGPPVHGEDS